MDKVKYVIKNNLDMDPMHDSYATEIRIEKNCLIVVYDNLDEGVLDPDGKPYYQNKRLTIRYEFDSYCDAKVYYKDNKVLWIDMIGDMSKFKKVTKECLFMSYKYSVSSFNELLLDYSLRKIINGKYYKYKYWGLEIQLDATNVTYIWEWTTR